MSLDRRPHSRFILVTITYTGITLFHQVDGFPVLVKEPATVVPSVGSGSLPPPILLSSDAWTFNSFDTAAVEVSSSIVARSSASNDVVHDKIFIPAIASIGVLVIICVICCYQLIVSRDNVNLRGGIPVPRGGYNEPPIFQSQHAIGGQENGHGGRPLSKGLSKVTRKSAPSISSSIPGSPSVRSDTMGYHQQLQQKRQQQQRQEFEQQQDPYRQYMMAHDHPQQYHQHSTHPSVPGSVMHPGEGVQPQPPHGTQMHATGLQNPAGATRAPSVVAQTARPPLAALQPRSHQTPMNANPAVRPAWEQNWGQQGHQNLQQQQPQQQQQPDPRFSHTPSAQTSSTRVTSASDVLSYMTPPEARRHPLPNNQSQLQPQNQDYFSLQRPASSTVIQPSQTGGSSTHGKIAHSAVPANYNPASRGHSSFPNATYATHMNSNSNQPPPGYVEPMTFKGR